MNKFCKDVVEFLQLEYADGYDFNITAYQELSGIKKIELLIKVGPHFTLTVGDVSMQYLFGLYRTSEYIEERKQWLWQKELVDMIEGS